LRGSDLLERSRTVARTDELTGLPNRRAINEQLPARLADARENGRPLSVAMIDLDRFKAYNDTHGHPAGDRLLKESAAGWRGQLREHDLLARYGGEEFLLVVRESDEEGAMRVASAVQTGLRNMPTPIHGLDPLTASIGIAFFPRHGQTLDEVLGHADRAMYQAKHDGRDRIVFAPAAVPTAVPGV
jgi:diguanylate cyclase (GGDEF)-like protein